MSPVRREEGGRHVPMPLALSRKERGLGSGVAEEDGLLSKHVIVHHGKL